MYFDYTATTKVDVDVLNTYVKVQNDYFANTESMHLLGQRSNSLFEKAKNEIKDILHTSHELIFTHNATEANNIAIFGSVYNKKGKVITSKIEHQAVLNTCHTLEKQGFIVTYLDVDKEGFIDLEQLMNSIRHDTILITIMFANNEIGTIQNVEEISKIAKMYNIIFHTDAVQACGNIPIDVKKMGIDMLSLSGHKLHATKGVGALYVKNGIEFTKFIDGGHQEKDKRASTENVPGIVGLGKACELANKNMNNHIEKLTKLRNYYISEVEKKIDNIKFNGPKEKRLPGNANFSFLDIDGQSLLLNLDEKGICASSGSACSTGSLNPSHVLKAIGLSDDLANGALRTSFGDDNTKEDIDYLVEDLKESVEKLRTINSQEPQ